MIEFRFDENYYGEGISKGIPRGLLAYHDGVLIVQEGMGLGAFAIQYNNRTYFCSIEKICKSGHLDKIIDVEYRVDMRLEWTFFQKSSPLITTFLEMTASKIYMKSEAFQGPILKMGTRLRRLLRISTDFKKTESLGHIKARYTIGKSDIHITVESNVGLEKYKFFIMNEIGGELFSRSVICGLESDPPGGWQKIKKTLTQNEKSHMLKSPSLGLMFYMEEICVPANIESVLFWGREVSGGYNWAGFESEIKCSTCGFKDYSYKVYFEKVEKEIE